MKTENVICKLILGVLVTPGLVFLIAPEASGEELPPDFAEVTGSAFPPPDSDQATQSVTQSESLFAGCTVLDFDDLTDTGGSFHSMAFHNPYNGVTFSGSIWHWSRIGYIQPHSGSVGLFNAFGRDAEFIEFTSSVDFKGAWVSEPHNIAKTFWYEGYLGGVKVAESPHYALHRGTYSNQQRFLAADFPVRVDKVVFRRTGPGPTGSWWVMDDITLCITTPVNIDIKPGSFPNSINLGSGGATPVAILGSATLDVTLIDTLTLSLGTSGVKTVGKKDKQLCSVDDVSGDFSGSPEGAPDGFDDLVCHFVTMTIVAEDGDTEATLSGALFDATPIEGTDTVNIVP